MNFNFFFIDLTSIILVHVVRASPRIDRWKEGVVVVNLLLLYEGDHWHMCAIKDFDKFFRYNDSNQCRNMIKVCPTCLAYFRGTNRTQKRDSHMEQCRKMNPNHTTPKLPAQGTTLEYDLRDTRLQCPEDFCIYLDTESAQVTQEFADSLKQPAHAKMIDIIAEEERNSDIARGLRNSDIARGFTAQCLENSSTSHDVDLVFENDPSNAGVRNFVDNIDPSVPRFIDSSGTMQDKRDDVMTNESARKHVLIGYSIYVASPPIFQHHFPVVSYIGADAPERLPKSLEQINEKIKNVKRLYKNKKPPPLSAAQRDYFEQPSPTCHICEKPIKCQLTKEQWSEARQNPSQIPDGISNEDMLLGPKVRDHNHLTQEYRGPAHSTCNINFMKKMQWQHPVFVHNLEGYDGKYIINMETQKSGKGKVEVIGVSSEKFKMITTKDFIFKDSMNFLNSSLSTLIDTLKKKVNETNTADKVFKHTWKLLQDFYNTGSKETNLENLQLLLRKQVKNHCDD